MFKKHNYLNSLVVLLTTVSYGATIIPENTMTVSKYPVTSLFIYEDPNNSEIEHLKSLFPKEEQQIACKKFRFQFNELIGQAPSLEIIKFENDSSDEEVIKLKEEIYKLCIENSGYDFQRSYVIKALYNFLAMLCSIVISSLSIVWGYLRQQDINRDFAHYTYAINNSIRSFFRNNFLDRKIAGMIVVNIVGYIMTLCVIRENTLFSFRNIWLRYFIVLTTCVILLTMLKMVQTLPVATFLCYLLGYILFFSLSLLRHYRISYNVKKVMKEVYDNNFKNINSFEEKGILYINKSNTKPFNASLIILYNALQDI